MDNAGRKMTKGNTEVASLFRELMAVREQLSSLQLQHESATVAREQAEEELRKVKSNRRRSSTMSSGINLKEDSGHQREILRLEQAKNDLQTENADLKLRVSTLSGDLDKVRTMLSTAEKEIAENRQKSEMMIVEAGTSGSLARGNLELAKAKQKISELQLELQETREQNTSLTETLSHFEDDEGLVKSVAAEKMRGQLMESIKMHVRRNNILQTTLQTTEEMVEKQKIEYEDQLQIIAAEANAAKERHTRDHSAVTEELRNVRSLAIQDRRQLLNEYKTMLASVRSQFEEFRRTSESALRSEISQLQSHIRTQMSKHEEELAVVVRSKDAAFDEMMAAKDAKILNLMEGTEYQAERAKLEKEKESMLRNHQAEIEQVRKQAEQAATREVEELMKELEQKQIEIEAAKGQAALMDARVTEAHAAVQQKQDRLLAREEAMANEVLEWQQQVEEANARADALEREKSVLRHRVVTMRVRERGGATGIAIGSGGMQAVIAELQRQLEDLSSKHQNALDERSQRIVELAGTKRNLSIKEQQLKEAVEELDRRGNEYSRLTTTFEQFLGRRVQATLCDSPSVTPGLTRRAPSVAKGLTTGATTTTSSQHRSPGSLPLDSSNEILNELLQSVQKSQQASSPLSSLLSPMQDKLNNMTHSPRGHSSSLTPLSRMALRTERGGGRSISPRDTTNADHITRELTNGAVRLRQFKGLSVALSTGWHPGKPVARQVLGPLGNEEEGDELTGGSPESRVGTGLDKSLYRSLYEDSFDNVKLYGSSSPA